MKNSGLLNLVICSVLLLSCPLVAQEKTNDTAYPVKQLASESSGYQRYAKAEGFWEPAGYQRYGPTDCGSEAEGYWEPDSQNYQDFWDWMYSAGAY